LEVLDVEAARVVSLLVVPGGVFDVLAVAPLELVACAVLEVPVLNTGGAVLAVVTAPLLVAGGAVLDVLAVVPLEVVGSAVLEDPAVVSASLPVLRDAVLDIPAMISLVLLSVFVKAAIVAPGILLEEVYTILFAEVV
ncbi:unnamed protein product, partial [Strongylus vulgaris]